MQEVDKRIALTRLMLADIEAKQAQLAEMESQYRSQLTRIVEFVIYREGDVANALSLMAEVQGKLDEVLQTKSHLEMIASKARVELEVLVLTKRVADARSQLAELEERQQELSAKLAPYSTDPGDEVFIPGAHSDEMENIRSITEEVAEVAEGIARLNTLITEASERAARTIHQSSNTST
jgi:hypothetical protein